MVQDRGWNRRNVDGGLSSSGRLASRQGRKKSANVAIPTGYLLTGTGSVDNGTREASCEAKPSEDRLAGLGSRRDVFGDGGWRIGRSCAGSRHIGQTHRIAFHSHAR